MSERISEIEARLKAATPGPWECDGRDVSQSYDLAIRTSEYTLERVGIIPGDYVRNNDAEFIANAPADIAYLLAELRARDPSVWDLTDRTHPGMVDSQSPTHNRRSTRL